MTLSRALLFAASCLVTLTLAVPGMAQQRRAAPVSIPSGGVTSIDVQGNQRIEADTIRSYMLLQPGDPMDPDRLDRSLRTLFATGLFRDVTITPQGGVIVVRVVENPIVNRVAFEGNRKLSDDVLRPEVQTRPRAVFTPQAAQGDATRLLELYARRGRYNARVTPKVIELEQNRVDVVYEIFEGDTTLVSRIAFVGNNNYSDSRLKEVVATREAAWYRFLSSSDTFEPERLNFDRELLRRYYLRQGYADVNIVSSTAELAPDRSGFFVTYTIDEGPRYRVTRSETSGTIRDLDIAALASELKLSAGDWYDGDAVERSVTAVADRANRIGFPFVEVNPRITRNREAATIEIIFEVTEGPRTFIERIDIVGNTRTQDRVIRREFRVAEGDALNAAQVRRSRQRIQDLGYFSRVDVNPSPGSAPDRAILNTRVAERATGEITLGGGYSTDAGFLLDFGIRERNLLGRGLDARFNAALAQQRSQVDISITDPSFQDRNLAVGADLFYIQRDLQSYSGYDERRAGFVLRSGFEYNEYMRQSVSYSLVQREIYNIVAGSSPYIFEQQGTSLVSQVSQTLAYDRRDSRLEPRQGYIVRLATDLAGLGGDVAFIRARTDGAYYVPFERLLGDPNYVLAVLGSIGYIENLGSDQERIIDRYFLGGENLRGFRIAGVGPRDLATGDSLGGRFIWTQSTEFRFPLPIPDEIGITGRAFVDVGSLSQSVTGPTVVDDPSPRVGTGVGISWRSPFGLINLDVAQAVVKQSYDQTQIFRFGFGTRF
ncbi:outer membrane protein assembly factor BamA [Humitalea sp. 24SJ18S-53]|uniref:outer membrane protein assembly factor BamA n=1 Tax=Humitalea sp. 24SJ18S-53 TaxID=3422307 RepID=UPI003D67E4D2